MPGSSHVLFLMGMGQQQQRHQQQEQQQQGFAAAQVQVEWPILDSKMLMLVHFVGCRLLSVSNGCCDCSRESGSSRCGRWE